MKCHLLKAAKICAMSSEGWNELMDQMEGL